MVQSELVSACEKLRATVQELAALKSKGDKALQSKVMEGAMLMVDFKQLNHELYLGLEELKNKTQTTKKELDHNNLQLQNLLYQKSHYMKEIKSCKEFKSKFTDEEIDKLPLEDFVKLAPPEQRQGANGEDLDEHSLELARLAFELQQRKDLCLKLQELQSRKKALSETVSLKRKTLDGLGEQLGALKRASLPLQQYLEMPVGKKAKQKKLAALLPQPLYILYTQLLAVEEVFNEPMTVKIHGSSREADTYIQKQISREASLTNNEGVHKVEDEMEEDEDGRRSKRTKSEIVDLYEAFPLTITLELKTSEEEILTVLTFDYLTRLHIICVKCDNDPEKNFLVNLFPEDDGCDTPNQANKVLEPNFVFDKSRTSRPYRWANHLAGLDFLPSTASGSLPAESSLAAEKGISAYREQQRVRRVVAALRLRCGARAKLKVQLTALEDLQPPHTYLNGGFFDQLCIPKCTLRTWKELKPDREVEQPSVQEVEASKETVTPMRPRPGLSRLMSEAGELGDGAPEDGELPDGVDEEGLLMSPLGVATPASAKSVQKFGGSVRTPSSRRELNGVEEMDAEKVSEEVVPGATSSEGTKHFCAVLRSGREKVELQALVEVPSDYPTNPPSFRLSLKRGPSPMPLPASSFSGSGGGEVPLRGVQSSVPEATNDLVSMQQEVNIRCPSILPTADRFEMLSFQLMCLMGCMDKHAEYDPWAGAQRDVRSDGPTNMRVCRGRDRHKILVTTFLEKN
ncbi:hypothetical protein CYMTET_31528 [Cymbomonas tetramitiformis]|uniref:THO complex subunit 5 n=1 Tax=Cymbomonas tetramitiformis TaxID=36881 RepID=A0AAE0FHP0_9CHLO|nr:hypothetical protein CYMTET_31528 [Cymbomonas tetramitiformis]